MSAAATTADPTGSTAVGPTGSFAPQDVGGEGENHEDTSEVEVIDRSKGEGVPVIKPALIYTKQGEVVEVDQKIVEAVDGFRVPDDFVRKGYVNFEHIPALKDIPMIAAKDIRVCLPERFAGGDDDLAAAEAAFDVVNNTANSDIGL